MAVKTRTPIQDACPDTVWENFFCELYRVDRLRRRLEAEAEAAQDAAPTTAASEATMGASENERRGAAIPAPQEVTP